MAVDCNTTPKKTVQALCQHRHATTLKRSSWNGPSIPQDESSEKTGSKAQAVEEELVSE